jgi:hypothetical protein
VARTAALAAPTGDDDPQGELVRAWLAGLPVLVEGTSAPALTTYDLTLTVGDPPGGGWRRLAAYGAPASTIGAAADWFAAVDADPAELDRLAAVGPDLDPDELGTWVEDRDGSFDTGWVARGRFELDVALDAIDDRRAREALRRRLDPDGAGTMQLVGIGRSVARHAGASGATCRVLVSAGSVDDDAQVAAALALLDDVGAPAPSDEVLATLLALGGSAPLALELVLLPDGPARVGLRVTGAPSALLVELVRQSGELAALDRVARVGGTLGDVDPSWVTCWVTPGGPVVEVGYELAG